LTPQQCAPITCSCFTGQSFWFSASRSSNLKRDSGQSWAIPSNGPRPTSWTTQIRHCQAAKTVLSPWLYCLSGFLPTNHWIPRCTCGGILYVTHGTAGIGIENAVVMIWNYRTYSSRRCPKFLPGSRSPRLGRERSDGKRIISTLGRFRPHLPDNRRTARRRYGGNVDRRRRYSCQNRCRCRQIEAVERIYRKAVWLELCHRQPARLLRRGPSRFWWNYSPDIVDCSRIVHRRNGAGSAAQILTARLGMRRSQFKWTPLPDELTNEDGRIHRSR